MAGINFHHCSKKMHGGNGREVRSAGGEKAEICQALSYVA